MQSDCATTVKQVHGEIVVVVVFPAAGKHSSIGFERTGYRCVGVNGQGGIQAGMGQGFWKTFCEQVIPVVSEI